MLKRIVIVLSWKRRGLEAITQIESNVEARAVKTSSRSSISDGI